MDIHKLQYFISVAETLSFTKAAKKHYISQTAMSQQIASIEAELEVLLFERSKNKVTITAAGEVFLKEAKDILARYEQAVKKTKDAMSGSEGSIHLGFSGPTEAEIVYEIVKEFQNKYPYVKIHVSSNDFKQLSVNLEDGIYDVIIALAGEIENFNYIQKLTIKNEQAFLAVSRDHPKAGKKIINAQEIADEKIIMLSEDCGQLNFEHMISTCKKDGYLPNITERVSSIDTLILMIELNRGVSILPRSMIHNSNDKIALIEIANTHHSFVIDMYWRKSVKSEYVKQFISTTKELYSC